MIDEPVDPERVVIELPARADFVSTVRLIVAAAAELEPDLPTERVEDLKLMVSEATTNAINAQRRAGVDTPIRVACRRVDHAIEVSVSDMGGGFDRAEIPDLPDPEDPERLLHESGLGIHLIETLADEVEITSTGSGTDIRLVVRSRGRRRDG